MKSRWQDELRCGCGPVRKVTCGVSMSKGVLGAASGAAAATVFLRPDILIGYARDVATTGSLFPRASSPSNKEMEHLTSMVCVSCLLNQSPAPLELSHV